MTTKQKRAPARDVITYAFVMSHQPCWSEGLRALLGKGKTLRQCLDVPGVSDADKIWLATREGACSERVQRLFAAACAERVLPLYEARFPDDERVRVAIQVATQFALGHAAAEELETAAEWAHDAWEYADACEDAAGEAAWTARDAASLLDAPDHAAWCAARDLADTADFLGTSIDDVERDLVETLRALLEDA